MPVLVVVSTAFGSPRLGQSAPMPQEGYRSCRSTTGLAEGTSTELTAAVDDGSGRVRPELVTVTLGDRS